MGTEGKYLILGLAGAGKRTLLEHLAIGDVVKSDDGKVSSITYKGIELHVSHIRRR
jgi:ABC-type molybdenum transport system ATPase subunit/photorepair protein PhrA